MDNNDILKKLRVALQLRDDQILDILALVDFRISKGEIGNFFRSEDHPKYVECKDQILRNFLNGLVIYLRGTKENPKDPKEVLKNVADNKVDHQKEKNPAQSSQKKAKYPSQKPSVLGNVKFKNGKPNKKES